MAEHPAEQIQLSPEDLAFVVAEAVRCGKSPSEVVHDALQYVRQPGTPRRGVNFADRDDNPDLAAWLNGPPDDFNIEDDPIWDLAGIGASEDGATDVSRNKKLYLYGPDLASTP